MGCGSQRTILASRVSLPTVLDNPSSPAKIEISPSTFVQANENRFEQMYKLGIILGEGNNCEVRKCVHRDTKHVRAVKIFNRQIMRLEDEDVIKELNVIKSIDHPNIVRVYEYFVDHRYIFLVMEYCQGGQLQGRITTQLQFTEPQVAFIMRQLLSAVVYMQNIGIVHREITPEKILLEEKSGDINIKIIDFSGSVRSKRRVLGSECMNYLPYLAPEVLTNDPEHYSDLWSCGVLMFVLLSGRLPFEGSTIEEIREKMTAGKYSMSGGLWNSVSSEAKDLIQRILQPVSCRIQASEALAHAWFTRFELVRSVPMDFVQRVLGNVLKFHFSTKLQLAALTFISTQVLGLQDTKDLREVFRMMDKNGDGTISKTELVEMYRETMPPSEAAKAVNEIMAHADTDGNGFMSYTEFLRASIDLKAVLTEKLLEEVFSVFDRDGNGTITSQEIMKVLKGNSLPDEVDDSMWTNMVAEVDRNGDGVIDINEFKEILLAMV